MRLYNVFLLIFALSALSIGASLNGTEDVLVNSALENATTVINNISLSETNDTYTNGILRITESYVKFLGSAIIETTKVGIFFGKENPEYFEPNFIIKIIKLLVWLAIIGLLIQPTFYLIIFITMCFVFVKDYINKKKKYNPRIKENE